MKVGILGGTFNPIHHGHLIIAEYTREYLDFDKILFIPTGIPPHKDRFQVLNGKTRSEMVSLAIESNPRFECSNIEIDKNGTSYTIDTINLLKKKRPKEEFHLIIGGDSLLELNSWKGFEELIDSVDIIVADRYGAYGKSIIKEIDRLNKKRKKKIINLSTPIIDISSTEIRKKVQEGRSIKYLTPENVEEYIMERGLYID